MPAALHVPGAGRGVLPALLAALVIGLDQIAKTLVLARLGPDQPDHRLGLVEPVLALEYVANTGAAFGLLRGAGPLLTLLSLLVLGGLVAAYARLPRPTTTQTLSLGLVAGGALGNLIDRVRLGHVVDFVAVGVWPKFNVADSAITLGVLLFAWHLLRASPPAPATGHRAGDTDATPGRPRSGVEGERLG